jgi:hypothetical protein
VVSECKPGSGGIQVCAFGLSQFRCFLSR